MAKKIEPRYWKKLERHPLSAEYPDLSGAVAEQMREGIRKHGVLNGRKVTLHPDPNDDNKLKVLDAWQMFSACVAENVKPQFQLLPKTVTPEEFVQIVNDHRRHESAETVIARIGTRQRRAAELRKEGHSTHAIAEELGVSQTTVVRDLEKVEAEAPERIQSRNGRSYPAERQPGDDTEAIKEEKRDARQNGKPMYEPDEANKLVGALIREVDKAGNSFKCKETPEANGLRRLMVEWKKQFLAWIKSAKKASIERSRR